MQENEYKKKHRSESIDCTKHRTKKCYRFLLPVHDFQLYKCLCAEFVSILKLFLFNMNIYRQFHVNLTDI